MRTGKMILVQTVLLVLLIPAVLLPIFREGGQEVAHAAATELRRILVRHGDVNLKMELEEYVVGVVLAEMPAEFEPEALKAQAVVARTFACRAERTGIRHGGAVCTDPACCQGYLAPGQFLQAYGTQEDLQRVRAAVSASAGLVLTYGGEPIEATYFSSTGGSTEDAAAVWGSSYPYLVPRESPEQVPEECTAFSRSWLEESLGVRLEEDGRPWFSQWEYTAGEGVASVLVGDRRFSGTALRQRLKLRSTVFTVTVENDAAVFRTRGYGHRVGMSQLGADAMAATGSTFRDILSHYYPGTQLEEITDSD